MQTHGIDGVMPQPVWDKEVSTITASTADWLLPGFISRGNMTLLTSLWKTGKTTLLAHFLARRASGQPFLGRPVGPGKSVVISEEPRAIWAERCQRFNFGGLLCLFPQPFPHLPTAAQWRELMAHVGQMQAEHGVDLIVIDSVTHFLRAEAIAVGVLDLLMPVRALTGRGMAALLMHHPRRRDSAIGSAGRGHGALHSEVDISIEMRHAGGPFDSRARRFYCVSRHPDTPPRLGFELNADGADYTLLKDTDEDGFTENWDTLRMVLDDAAHKMTRQEILDDWPGDYPKPSSPTLWRWLQNAAAAQLLKVEGTGRKTDPFRYWLLTAEARWRQDPLYEFNEKMAESRKRFQESLRTTKIGAAWKTDGQ